MAWCPSCKNEFVNGINICPKCDVKLFNNKEKALSFDYENLKDRLDSFDENGDTREDVINRQISEQNSQDYNSDAFNDALRNAFSIPEEIKVTKEVYEKELDVIMERSAENNAKAAKGRQLPSLYENSSAKAEEVKSSAISLIIVGVVGLVIMVLMFFEIIPIKLNAFSHYTIPLVMGALFICLIVAGFLSIKSFKHLKKKGSDEDKLDAEIKEWYVSNLSAELIDENLFSSSDDTPEEEKYFKRYSKINSIIRNKFLNLDNNYYDHIVEDIYEYFFDEV